MNKHKRSAIIPKKDANPFEMNKVRETGSFFDYEKPRMNARDSSKVFSPMVGPDQMFSLMSPDMSSP